MYNEFDDNEPLLSSENELNSLKNEITEKNNYLNKQKLEMAIKIKKNLRKDMEAEVNKIENDSKLKRFFKKLMKTCK